MESLLTRHGVIEHTTKDENYSLLPENFLEKYLIADNIDKDSKVDDMLHAWSEYLDKSAGTEDIREIIEWDNFDTWNSKQEWDLFDSSLIKAW